MWFGAILHRLQVQLELPKMTLYCFDLSVVNVSLAFPNDQWVPGWSAAVREVGEPSCQNMNCGFVVQNSGFGYLDLAELLQTS
jgi:hypothetical protein